MLRILLFLIFIILFLTGKGQYNWKQEKDEDGIKVFISDLPGSKFKAVKVECTFKGSYSKLISILLNISQNSKWVYNSKVNYILKQNTPLDFIYYTETHFPWPLSNRDVIIHLRIKTDSLPKFLIINGTGIPRFIPEVTGKVRVTHYSANWKVTMPDLQTLQIQYVLEADPGGSIPAWASNLFIDKGPYETFKKLAKMLEK